MICDKVVCGKMVCVTKTAAREAGRRRGGIQNQKQEPHTKMWEKLVQSLHTTITYQLFQQKPPAVFPQQVDGQDAQQVYPGGNPRFFVAYSWLIPTLFKKSQWIFGFLTLKTKNICND